jgi:hypothetical protein
MPAIAVLLLVSASCLLHSWYHLAREIAFGRRAMRASGRISRLTAETRCLDGPGLEALAPVGQPVEIATVAVLVAPRRTVDRTLPHSPVDPGRYRVGDAVSLRLDPHGRREPVLDGAGPDPLVRWAAASVLFGVGTVGLIWLLALLAGGQTG